jgi:oligogalacturonide lyase
MARFFHNPMIITKSLFTPRALAVFTALTLVAGFPCLCRAQDAGASTAPAVEPPTSWIDPDTGHRVIRLTREPGSDSFYFNFNAYTPDGKEMVYTTPDGISVLNLTTFEARQVVSAPNRGARTIIVGHVTPTIYYTKTTKSDDPSKPDDPAYSTVWATNVDTGETRKLVDLPRRASVVTINADETLGCGSFLEGDATGPGVYGGGRSNAAGRMGALNLGEPLNKGEMMAKRLAAKLPITMFTVDLRTGKINILIQHSTDWLNHMQFSPSDPTLLLYCHEGLWWLVDRIWTMHTDGTKPQLIHKRTIENEIAGHEWWGADGKMLYYQLHFPRGWDSSFIASYNEDTGERIWYHYKPDESSIHDNSSPDGKMFCGDGDNRSPWIFLFRPVLNKDNNTLGADLVKGGYLQSEKLVNMSKTAIHGAHNYRLEPNPSFTPDQKYIVFRSNMFGPDYAFAVEVAKASAP